MPGFASLTPSDNGGLPMKRRQLFVPLVSASFTAVRHQSLLLLFLLLMFTAPLAGLISFSDTLPFIEFHAEMLQAPGGGLTLPQVMLTAEFGLLVLCGVILALLLPMLSPIGASLLTLLASLPFVLLALSDPMRNPLVPMQYSLLVILMLFGTDVLINYFLETHRRQRLLYAFSQYVPPEIARRLQHEKINLEGESRQVTILFSDLKNFTGVAEELPPRDLVLMLNDYFTAMTEVLHAHGATIDKFIGDSVMAFWGAPLAQEDHARSAVMASIDMHARYAELSATFSRRGWPVPEMGIGINSGLVNVGNMGSRLRLAYTVIGDPVNLASRLENLTRVYQVPTIIGEETRRAADDLLYRELDIVTVKGKTSNSRIFLPLGVQSRQSDAQYGREQLHQEAMRDYYAGRHDRAISAFRKLAADSESPAYYGYMVRQARRRQERSAVGQVNILDLLDGQD